MLNYIGNQEFHSLYDKLDKIKFIFDFTEI